MKFKRLFAALLAVCLALTLAMPALAAGVPWEEAVQAVNALGILSGDDDPEGRVTRAEFTAMAVRAGPGGDGVGQAAVSPYPDVPKSHWASGYVEAAVSQGLVSAFSDGTFRPDQEIKLAEGVSMVLALLGYGPGDFSGAYPSGQLAMYRSLRLDQEVSASGAASPLTRRDAVYLFYNLLSAKTKAGTPYIQTLGHTLDASGRPDIVSLVNGEMEGPAVADQGWAPPFTPRAVYRNGSAVTLNAVQPYDIVYWNADIGTVWAYAQKATGPIQAIDPDRANPASVTVAGRTYAIESSSAAYDLSDLGRYRLGDTVTLLLGRSGGVAAVADVSASAGEKVGVVLEAASASYPDGSGGVYTAQTVTLLSTDGQTYQYQTKGGQRPGSVVRASVDDGGQVTLKGLSSASLSGRVSGDGTKLGSYTFARDAQVLDVGDKRGAVVYPRRLAGLRLESGDVRWYSLNAQGEIEALILNDVTGDVYDYGVLTRFEDMGGEDGRYYSYEFDVGGTVYAVSGSIRYPVSGGPIRITGSPASPDRLNPLTAVKSGRISGNQLVAGNQKYTLSDSVVVYEHRDGKYLLSSLARAEEKGEGLTGWYDKAEQDGGRIRVIVVQ